MKHTWMHIILLCSIFLIFISLIGIVVFIKQERTASLYESMAESPDEIIENDAQFDGIDVSSIGAMDADASAPCNVSVPEGGSIQSVLDSSATASNKSIIPYVLCVSGKHNESIVTTRDDLIIRGDGNTTLTQGSAANKIVRILHDRVTLSGFIVDGRTTSGGAQDNKLVWIQGAHNAVVTHNILKYSGGECVRILANSTSNEISYNDITGCGIFKYGASSKNGEAVYIGLDPEALATFSEWDKYVGQYGLICPSSSSICYDDTGDTHVHHNRIQPAFDPYGNQGNECVDIKEGSEGNVVEFNTCQGQMDPESAAFDTRASRNEFSHNTVLAGGVVNGAGLRIGAEFKNGVTNNQSSVSAYQWVAEKNIVFKNRFLSYQYPQAVKMANKMTGVTQGLSCGNEIKPGGVFSSSTALLTNPSCSANDDDGLPAGVGSDCVGVVCQNGSVSPPPVDTSTPAIPTATITPTKPTSTPNPLATATSIPPSPTPTSPSPTKPVSSGKIPQIISITSPKDSKVILEWNPVSGAQKYRIYISKPGKKKLYYEKSTKKTTAQFNLKSCKKYYFAVSAVDSNGNESQLSLPVSILVSIGNPVHSCK